MKKSLLALAALASLGGFTGAASAQSSVTVFGVIDESINYIENKDKAGNKNKSWYLPANHGNSTGANQGKLFNRRSTVSLMGKWGEVRLGRDYNPSFWNWVFFDVNGANGLGQALNLASPLGSEIGRASCRERV